MVENNHKINFNSLLCVNCNLCEEVCEPKSISKKFQFNPSGLYNSQKETLISFDTKRCNECGNNFTYKGGELICQRCKTEEDESYALHNVSREGINI